ncbi:DUF2637 domain-containing protein, partial [Streptomyces xanthophaeus]
AHIRAVGRQNRAFGRARAREGDMRGLTPGPGSAPVGAEPAIAEPGLLPPLRRRPSLQAVNGTESADLTISGPRTVDLTAEDDTQTIPRLDSLERKLKDLEQQFG